jgi:hypothetical protein
VLDNPHRMLCWGKELKLGRAVFGHREHWRSFGIHVEFMEMLFALELMVLVGPVIELYQILFFRGDSVTRVKQIYLQS